MQCKDKSFTGEGFKASSYKKKRIGSVHVLSSERLALLSASREQARPSECSTGVVTSLCAACSEDDQDT